MKKQIATLILSFVGLLPNCFGQGTFQPVLIMFDGPLVPPPGTGYIATTYSESGFVFSSLGYGFTRMGPGRSTRPENGTAYLAAVLGDSLIFSASDGSTFSLLSVDLAEYSTVVPDAVMVQFVGYFADGSSAVQMRTTDGIIDGTGPLVDFQTFRFQGWNNLVRVEIPTYGWSLDNLVVGVVPEPGAGALVLFGGLLLWWQRQKRGKR